MNSFFLQFSQMMQRYTMGQRVVISALLIGMISAMFSLVMWANQPEFEVLFADIDPNMASKMVSDLQGSKVAYQLENGGRTIMVPRDKVSEWRIRFTELGYAGDMVSGYEIFDNNDIGMTSFKQKLNRRRALEGELTRTINQFPGVMNSRVHLALPEGKLFQEQKGGKGSVVLYLTPGTYLDREQVKGISALVANSVDGIEPESIVVVDTEGNLLSDNQGEQSAMGSTGSQWDLKIAVESRIQAKVQDILDGVLGYQNSVVKISADLNFEQIERTTEAFDPESVVILSEERQTESTRDLDTSKNVNKSYSKENVLTNYELNKTTEHYVAPSGNVQRLTVAVLVNGRYEKTEDAEGEVTREYKPRSNKELTQIAALVKSAVGFDEERGDLVQVENIQFDRSSIEEDKEYFEASESKAMWAGIANKGMLLVSVVLAFLFVKSLLKKFSENDGEGMMAMLPQVAPQMAMPGGYAQQPSAPQDLGKTMAPSQQEIDEDIYIKKLSPEAQAKIKAKGKMTSSVVDYAKESPEDASKLIRSWITQPGAPQG